MNSGCEYPLKYIFATAVMTLTGSAAAEPVVYTPDKWHTRILFTVDHMGLSSYTGRFTDFEIDLLLDEENLANSRVEVTIPVSTIDTFSPELNRKMPGESFFDTDNYPEIHFRSTNIELTGSNAGKIGGELSIKGRTLPATFEFTINGKVMHPFYKLNNIGFTATGKVDSRAYGVNNLPEWMVGSIVDVRIEVEAFEGEGVPYYDK